MKYISYNKFIRNTVIISTLIISVLFTIYGVFIQSHSIEKSIQNDSKLISNLVFENLYTIMKNGGAKEDLDKKIKEIMKHMPDVNIEIGKDERDEEFDGDETEVLEYIDHIEFTSPVFFKQECLSCHKGASAGEVAAVMHIEYPIVNLKVSIKDIGLMVAILFIISIVVIFVIWYIYLSKYFVNPIQELIEQMKNISSHKDLEKDIVIETVIQEVKDIEDVFNDQNKNLLKTYNELESISNTDILTNTYNRKKFDEYSGVILRGAKRHNYPFSLILIDLNKFKIVNDTYGHDVGDEILVLFSEIVKKSIRESDLFFRVGGDEFVLLLPHTVLENTSTIIDKIKTNCESTKYEKDNILITLSASFGAAEFIKDADDIQGLLKIADKRMYEDKSRGR